MTMNLVAIAGVPPPESSPRKLISCVGISGEPTAEEAQRSLMWMSLAALGLGAIAGYYLQEHLV